jgi:hypothetical protein
MVLIPNGFTILDYVIGALGYSVSHCRLLLVELERMLLYQLAHGTIIFQRYNITLGNYWKSNTMQQILFELV